MHGKVKRRIDVASLEETAKSRQPVCYIRIDVITYIHIYCSALTVRSYSRGVLELHQL